MQVCCVKDATDKEILDVCNKENPSGATAGWSIVIREGSELHGDNMVPVQCKDHSDRIHVIVVC